VLRERRLAPSAGYAETRVSAGVAVFRGVECVLSEVALLWDGDWVCIGFSGVDGSCAWRGWDARGLRQRCCGLCVGCENEKGIWWMPWRQEAMKDVARCENLGGAASGL
jgi:hypothetical protein